MPDRNGDGSLASDKITYFLSLATRPSAAISRATGEKYLSEERNVVRYFEAEGIVFRQEKVSCSSTSPDPYSDEPYLNRAHYSYREVERGKKLE